MGLDVPPPRRKPYVVTIHDLAPMRYPDDGELPRWTDDLINGAWRILTPSAFTAEEVSTLLGVARDRVSVIGGGPALDARDAQPLAAAELERLGIDAPFVLRYGGYTIRKNVPLLLEAWAEVSNGSLVLCGPAQDQRSRILADAPSLRRITVLDYAPTALLARLVKSSAALVTTSTYEGFGLPPLEALVAGVPVVAVSAPFVREVCGDSVTYVNASPRSLAAALSAALDAHCVVRPSVTARTGFPSLERMWEQAAKRVVSAYRSIDA